MDANSLQRGEVVYECGLRTIGDHSGQVVVSTMKYMGKKRKEFTVSDCDVPFEFYEFVEYKPFATSGEPPTDSELIPSANDVEKRMLTLQELIDELEFWRDQIGKDEM